MSGVLIYSEKEAKRNTFAINKFKEELGVTLAINDYDGTADFIINRTNNYKPLLPLKACKQQAALLRIYGEKRH